MKTIPGFLIILFMTMTISGQEALKNRKPAVAGSFYPAGQKELKRTLQELFDELADPGKPVLKNNENVRALVSPHAGYVFSGTVTASAIACIPPDAQYDNIFLIGSSHRVSFPGASVYTEGDYETPLGVAQVNREAANQLVRDSKTFSYYKEAHTTEHSLEVQIPFLQYHLKNEIRIIPIIIGTHNTKVCREIAEELKPYFNSRNLFIISSDFSHYPPFDEAVKLDKKTADAFLSGDPGTFLATIRENSRSGIRGLATSMCGWTSGLVLLHLCQEENDLEFKHIMYRNSGHSKFGDNSGVVGYNSIVVTGIEQEKEEGDFSISHRGQETLLQIARQSIGSVLGKNEKPVLKDPEMPADIRAPLGAFVTLNLDGKLRGCIGRFTPSDPLYKTVSEMARAAAFSDTRFDPLSGDEFNDVKIEISVLSPLRKIDNIDNIVLGKHGVYIKKGYRSGTFLPQVANNRNWEIQDFLGHISRDKAGLGWTGWKDADIYIYEAFIFEEE